MAVCVLIYMIIAATAVGALGYTRFANSPEPLALILREIGQPWAARVLGASAVIALPTVILAFFFGQSRIFFTVARDGLLPASLARVSSRGTPVRITIFTAIIVSIIAGLVPLADIAALANAGTLAAFIAVCAAMLVLRKREPNRERKFKAPLPWVIGIGGILGCLYLFYSLPTKTQLFFFAAQVIGLILYAIYGHGAAARARVVNGASTNPIPSAAFAQPGSANALKVLSIVLLGLGAVGTVVAFTMTTSVSTQYGEVSNLSLINRQQTYLIASGFAAVVGAVFLLIGRK